MKKIQEINARLEKIADELQALSDLSQENELDQNQIDLVNELDAEFKTLEEKRMSLQAVQDKLDAAKAAKAIPETSSMVEPAQIEDSVKEDDVIPARVKNQRSKHFGVTVLTYVHQISCILMRQLEEPKILNQIFVGNVIHVLKHALIMQSM